MILVSLFPTSISFFCSTASYVQLQSKNEGKDKVQNKKDKNKKTQVKESNGKVKNVKKGEK